MQRGTSDVHVWEHPYPRNWNCDISIGSCKSQPANLIKMLCFILRNASNTLSHTQSLIGWIWISTNKSVEKSVFETAFVALLFHIFQTVVSSNLYIKTSHSTKFNRSSGSGQNKPIQIPEELTIDYLQFVAND